MISKKYSIEEFVEAVKEKKSQKVIELAIEEATKADRRVLKNLKKSKNEDLQKYSRQLKRLIDYHRFEPKPHRKKNETYNLYMKHWGNPEFLRATLPINPLSTKAVSQ